MIAALMVVAGVALSSLGSGPPAVGTPPPSTADHGNELPRVAVLPCENASPDPSDAFRADGLHDEILPTIQRISSLQSIGRTSVQRFQSGQTATDRIATELGVNFIGECTVQRSENRIRVIFQLLDPAGIQVWGEEYDRDPTLRNILDIQIDIAQQIARTVGSVVAPEEEERIASRPTENLDAYDLYLLGRNRWWTRDLGAMREAIDFFEASLAADSTFALAYAGLAQTFMVPPAFSYSVSPLDIHEWNRRAMDAARKALTLDPELSDAHAALGNIAHMYDWDWQEAEKHLTKALEMAPGNSQALAWKAEVLDTSSRPEEALELAWRAAEIDPLSYNSRTALAYSLWNAGYLTRAEEEFRHQMEIWPENCAPSGGLTMLLRYAGRGDDVRDLMASVSSSVSDLPPEERAVLDPLFDVFRNQDDPTERPRLLATVRGTLTQIPPQSPGYFMFALFLPQLGEVEEGIEALKGMVAARNPLVFSLNSPMVSFAFRRHIEYLAVQDEVGMPYPGDSTRH
jgi:TolB-like protein